MSLSASRTHRNHTPENSNSAYGNRANRMLFFDKQVQSFFRPVTHIQPKLTVNAPNDIYEKEADAVADQVMKMPDPQIQRQEEEEEEMLQMKEHVPAIRRKCEACEAEESLQRQSMEEEEVMMKLQSPAVQRKCAECEAEEKLQRKPLAGNITPFFQRKKSGGGEVSQQTAATLQSTEGTGSFLPEHTRSWMESRFGADFSQVKVHTDSRAVQLSRNLNAQAFTYGSDIYFDKGKYAPGTSEGKRLLAHELTHVVQQNQARHHLSKFSGGTAIGKALIYRYRSRGSANFGACDDSPRWVEKPFTDKENDPWIEKITVSFDGTATDSDGDLVPTGELTAMYHANKAALPNLTGIRIVGGKASEGLTDKGTHSVKRIEGCGYHHTSVPKTERLTGHKRGFKYFKPALVSKASMSFAVFFLQGKRTGNQAIHEGSLSFGSLACVHVGTKSTMRQINYHSRTGKTTVEVSYAAAALKELCCARYKTKRYMVSNPCKGQDPKKCS